MYRYLAAFWDSRACDAVVASRFLIADISAGHDGWKTVYEAPGAFAVHRGFRQRGNQAHELAVNGGVVLGTLFQRQESCGDKSSTGGKISFDGPKTAKIVGSAGRSLIDDYWGSYTAIVRDQAEDGYHVFSDPTGNMPCYRVVWRGLNVFCSHAEDCIRRMAAELSIDRSYFTRWLLFSGLRSRQTGLGNVEHILGGERLTLARSCLRRSQLWNPAQFARSPAMENVAEAAVALRSTVRKVVHAHAACYANITLKLSGGLDSSIVAGCLAQVASGPTVRYLNFVAGDALSTMTQRGDERYFARLIAERWNTPLTEKPRLATMDLRRLWAAPPRATPSLLHTAMEVDDAEIEFVQAHGVEAFFSGQAGDSVFQVGGQSYSATDYVYLQGLTLGMARHLIDASRGSGKSIWSVLAKALKYGLLRIPQPAAGTFLTNATLVNPDLLAGLTEDDFSTAWGSLAAGLPPGKRDLVSGLAGSAYHQFVFHSDPYADHVDPLNAQPIWELMLQIPTYIMQANGMSRGLARRAFADLLPAEIRRRTIKGTGAAFYPQVVARNQALLRETLLDGLLVHDGYLDRRALMAYFAGERQSLTIPASQMLHYLAAEVWLRRHRPGWDCPPPGPPAISL